MHNKSFQISKYLNQLNTNSFGRAVCYFRTTESTSTYLKKKSPRYLEHGLTCIADFQSEGRGQHQKKWDSEPFENLMFTVILKPRDINRIQILPLLAGCSVLKAVEYTTGLELGLKWPNDIMHGTLKLGGILAESVFTGSRIDRLLIGIGINVNQQTFIHNGYSNATSLINLSGKPVDRELLMARIMDTFERDYMQWENGDIQVLRSINNHITGYGDWCYVEINGNRLQDPHKILGIDPRGFLLALDSNDKVKTFTHEQVRIFSG